MANTIKLKRASGSDPSASDLSTGELAIRTSNCKLFSKNDSGSAIGIVAGSADTLTTARTIAGVSFDGSANISLNNNAITNGAGYLADIVSDTSPQLGGDLASNGNDILMGDNDEIKLGAGGDLKLEHQSSSGDSLITEVGSGNFIIQGSNIIIRDAGTAEKHIEMTQNGSVDLYHNGSKKAETYSAGLLITGTLSVDTGNIVGNDNAKLKLGTGDDLQLFHSGSQSEINSITGGLVIKDTGGFMRIRSDELKIQSESNENYIECDANGAVQLFHNNSVKFVTSSSGGTITGTLSADGLDLSGSVGAAITAASDGSTITLDLGANTHQSVTLGGNRTFAAPSNQTVGQSGSIFITQDGTGSRTASFNSAFKFVGGTAPTLSTAANAVDRIDYVIKSSNVIHCAVSLDVK